MSTEPRHEIPPCWNADFALAFVGFLEGLIGAIWDRHGPEMYNLIEQRADALRRRPNDAENSLDDLNAQLPF